MQISNKVLTSCDFALHFVCVILWYAYILQFYDFMYFVYFVGNDE